MKTFFWSCGLMAAACFCLSVCGQASGPYEDLIKEGLLLSDTGICQEFDAIEDDGRSVDVFDLKNSHECRLAAQAIQKKVSKLFGELSLKDGNSTFHQREVYAEDLKRVISRFPEGDGDQRHADYIRYVGNPISKLGGE